MKNGLKWETLPSLLRAVYSQGLRRPIKQRDTQLSEIVSFFFRRLWSYIKGQAVSVYAMKPYGELDVWLQSSLTSALDGGDCSASRPGRLTSRYSLNRSLGGP